MKRLIIFSIITIFLLISCNKCKKEDQLKTYTIKGRLMSTCSSPASNKNMFLSQLYGQLTGTGGVIKNFTCDVNGYFSVEYKPENSSKIKLGVDGASYILEDIPSGEDVNLGNVFTTRSSNIVFKIKIINNFPTILDTFYCGIYSTIHQPLLMPQPFHDTIFPAVYTIFNNIPKYPNNSNSYFEYGWYFKNGNQNSNLHSYSQNINACNTSQDTIIIILN